MLGSSVGPVPCQMYKACRWDIGTVLTIFSGAEYNGYEEEL